MSELYFPQKKACKLFSDDEAANSISEKPMQHDRIKHVEINKHFIMEKLENKIIILPFVRLKDQLVDILIKAVTSEAFEQMLCKLGIGDPKI